LLRQDGLGFSLHDTLIHPGTSTTIEYKHHLEAVYCIEGSGEVETLADGQVHPIGPGTLYALDKHDRHILRAHTPMRLISVFNPALGGKETHDASGSYPKPEI
jgi:L-ectoine synthase